MALVLPQLWPQAPQFTNVLSCASQPFAGLPSQSAHPDGQPQLHTPAVHIGVPLEHVHTCPQEPQLDGLVCTPVSHPLFGLPSQSL
jgi:hypothetical protein